MRLFSFTKPSSLALAAIVSILPCHAEPPATPSNQPAAESSDAEAQFSLARKYLRGEGFPKDPQKAFELMSEAAKQGHPEALGGMGYFYAMGVVVPEDDAAAVEWFRKGADKGSAKAKMNLGLALARGIGVEKNEAEGLKLIDAAAESGIAEPLYVQGETYYWGQFGRAVDYKKAAECFAKPAAEGHLESQNNLGVLARDGLGVEKNEKAALAWFRTAAEKGQPRAQSNLGHTLGTNSADRAVRVEAVKWLLLASARNEITAVRTMEELTPVMPPDELEEARKAADAFSAR
jgi:hypothetical protein